MEVEEDCFSTNKTHSKNEIAPTTYFYRSNSLKLNNIIEKEDVSVSDWEKQETQLKSSSDKNEAKNYKDRNEQHRAQNNLDMGRKNLRLSFGKGPSTGEFETVNCEGPIKNFTKKNCTYKDSNENQQSNRTTVGHKNDPKKNLNMIFKRKPNKITTLSVEKMRIELRSRSDTNVIKISKSPVTSNEMKTQTGTKRFFRSFKEILLSKAQNNAKTPGKFLKSTDKPDAAKKIDFRDNLFYRTEGRSGKNSPDLNIEHVRNSKSFLKIKVN